MRYVIIGNSIAGVAAVEAIRRLDGEGSITIVGRETHHVYSRPLISYFLQGKTDETRMRYRPADFYEKHGCMTILGVSALSVDPAAHAVTLENGRVLPYDKLLVATGSSPFVPPMEGLDTVERQHAFMTLDDAKGLEKDLSPDANVLVIGAGLIGLKCAEGIFARVKSVDVIDLAPRILSSVLDEEGAAVVQAHLEEKGVRLHLSDSVSRFEPHTAYLKSGKEISFDVLVLAVGVRPNVSLVKDAGGRVNRGIVTDAYMQTSLQDVYAAGDCVESYDVSCDTCRVLAVLPGANMQGECAGTNMAGGAKAFEQGIPMNAMGLFGLHMITAGTYEGETFACAADGYKKLFYEGDRLKGYILIGNVEKAGIYTALIREKTELSSIDFPLICQKPGLMAFSRNQRTAKLGGVPR